MSDLPPTLADTVNGEKWRRISAGRKAGVLTPLTGLRSRQSAGIGDILDLELLVDWCQKTGQKIIQILPVNDTGLDASPYSACSAFALNPAHLALREIPGIDLEDCKKFQKTWEAKDRLVYHRLRTEKMRLLRNAFLHGKKNLGKDPVFRGFCEENRFWLDVYTAFMVMKDACEQKSWRSWGQDSAGNGRMREKILKDNPEDALFYKFLQWQLDIQWRRAHAYASGHGVLLKGDLPFLLNADSSDVWAWPEYFHHDLAAGCPPDYYNADGQYWGFPTYRWDAIEKDGGRWWIERLRHAERYFDIFRIDHVLGFFRIWSIPLDWPATLGQFIPAICVTREILEQNRIGGDEVDELLRRKILLPAAWDGGDSNAFAFKWMFQKDSWFSARAGLDHSLKDRLMHMERFFAEKDEIQNDRWRQHGEKWLAFLSQNTRMLVCAEDLGTVPPCVRPCLKDLGITTLIIDRWSKFIPTDREKREGKKEYWVEPWHYEPLSVATPSNHDMPTVRGWWKELGMTEEGKKERHEHHRRYGWKGYPPEEINADGVRFILKRNLDGKSVFTILSIRDWLDLNGDWHSRDPLDDRINLPGTVSEHNWSWRMPLCLEDMLDAKADGFNRNVADMIAHSGR